MINCSFNYRPYGENGYSKSTPDTTNRDVVFKESDYDFYVEGGFSGDSLYLKTGLIIYKGINGIAETSMIALIR